MSYGKKTKHSMVKGYQDAQTHPKPVCCWATQPLKSKEDLTLKELLSSIELNGYIPTEPLVHSELVGEDS